MSGRLALGGLTIVASCLVLMDLSAADNQVARVRPTILIHSVPWLPTWGQW